MDKLFTKEDSFHIHKTLGIICLMNFIYRFGRLTFTGDMGFNSDIDAYLVMVHLLLGVTSLIFRISSVRHTKLPIIYPELRLHNIIFSARSVICFYLCFYKFNIIYRFITCILTNILADIVTYFLKRGTTIRDVVFFEGISDEDLKREKRTYSGSQLAATIIMLGNCDMIFGPIFAIQIAPFTMTLVKKGIMNTKTAHLIYAFALTLNNLTVISSSTYIIKVGILKYLASYLRFDLNMNKYIMWILLFSLYYYTMDYQIENNIYINLIVVVIAFLKRIKEILEMIHN